MEMKLPRVEPQAMNMSLENGTGDTGAIDKYEGSQANGNLK